MMLAENIARKPRILYQRGDTDKRIRMSITTVLALCTLAVVMLCMLYVAQRIKIMTLTYEIAETQRLMEDAIREQGFLNVEIARSKSLERIEEVAKNELAMVRPQSRQYLVMDTATVNIDTQVAVNNQAQAEEKGILAMAAEWVTSYWPRIASVEAKGK
jgi:cell division protein FtsL